MAGNKSNDKKFDLLCKKIDGVSAEVKEMNSKLFDHKDGIAVHVHDNTEFRKSTKKQIYAIWLAFLALIGKIIYSWWDVNKNV